MDSFNRKRSYRNQAIKTFFLQEESSEADYIKAFNVLTQCFADTLPQLKLYKYRSNLNWKYTMPILDKNMVYLCPLDKQNDLFEFAFNDDFGEIVKRTPILKEGKAYTLLNGALASQSRWGEQCEKMSSYKAKMSITCFCEEKDNVLLWTHYANNSKGICIEYSGLDLLERFQCSLLPIVYQRTPPGLPDSEEIDTWSPYKIAFERVSTKSDIWSYEREWRIIRCCESDANNHYIEFPTPTAVYLGAKVSKVLAERVFETCVAKSIPLHIMVPDRYSFSLRDNLIYSPKRDGTAIEKQN